MLDFKYNISIVLYVFMFIFLISFESMATIYVSLDDEETYEILNRLEAEGIIESGLFTTKPLNEKEIIHLISEAEEKSKNKSFVYDLVWYIKNKFESRATAYIKPLDNLYIKYIYQSSDMQQINYNNEGDNYLEGSNFRLGYSSKAELDNSISFYINPELKYNKNEGVFTIRRAYGILSISNFDIQIGKDSGWWGPGHHGSILFSNNAEPFTMIRITNSEKLLLPWIFKYLGPLKFTFFATKLEKERTVPEPYLWGMRINFKPVPYIEIGLQRTALLGGSTNSNNLKTWLRSFLGEGEHKPGEPGDQRAGFDVKLTLPFKTQPLQLYFEADGEDSANKFPVKWGYLAGIYMPRILNFERISLRLEFANTYAPEKPGVWYSHHIYGKNAYFYKGRVIGHHIGPDARDWFFEISYLIPNRLWLTIAYDMEYHNIYKSTKEERREIILKLKKHLTKKASGYVIYKYGSMKNIDSILNNDRQINQIIGWVEYRF